RGAEPHARGATGEKAQQVERGRDLAAACEMVLDNEQALEAELLRVENVVDEPAVALAVRARAITGRFGSAEEAEFHSDVPFGPSSIVRAASIQPIDGVGKGGGRRGTMTAASAPAGRRGAVSAQDASLIGPRSARPSSRWHPAASTAA